MKSALTLAPIDKVHNGGVVERKRMVFNLSKCRQCGTCIAVCPYDMIRLKDEGNCPLVNNAYPHMP